MMGILRNSPVGMVPVQPKLLEQATLERRADRDYVLKVPRETQMGNMCQVCQNPPKKQIQQTSKEKSFRQITKIIEYNI